MDGLYGQEAVSVEKASGRANDRINDRINDLPLTEGEHAALVEVAIDPYVTIRQLEAILGISDKTVRRRISALKDKGYIRRVGSRKTGHWQVLKPAGSSSSDGK